MANEFDPQFPVGLRPLHRDDVPMDVAEALVSKLQELMPGYKVVFAGDIPVDQTEVRYMAEQEKFLEAVAKAFADGCCFYCGKKMPNIPDIDSDDEVWNNWQPAEGWHVIPFGPDGDDGPSMFECPECHIEALGVPQKIRSPYLEDCEMGYIDILMEDNDNEE